MKGKGECFFCHREMVRVTRGDASWYECPAHPRLLPKSRTPKKGGG